MKYKLYVYCRRNGVSRDAGLHDECEAESDAEAQRKLYTSAFNLRRHYDTIACTIKQDGRTVGEFTIRR